MLVLPVLIISTLSQSFKGGANDSENLYGRGGSGPESDHDAACRLYAQRRGQAGQFPEEALGLGRADLAVAYADEVGPFLTGGRIVQFAHVRIVPSTGRGGRGPEPL